MPRRRRRRTPPGPLRSEPVRSAGRTVRFGWAEVPLPRDMSYFDQDSEPVTVAVEEGGEGVVEEGSALVWWDLDDWGDDE